MADTSQWWARGYPAIVARGRLVDAKLLLAATNELQVTPISQEMVMLEVLMIGVAGYIVLTMVMISRRRSRMGKSTS